MIDPGPVLVIAPHPDDEVLGVGGTIARLAAEGRTVVVAVVTRGYPPHFSEERTAGNREAALEAHRILGVTHTRFLDFPAARLDTVAHADLNAALATLMADVRPGEVYIPFAWDVHLDHQLTALSAMVAVRPCRDTTPAAVYAYETLSETNWNLSVAGLQFCPTVYVNITDQLERKLEAFSVFGMQIKPFPHERSLEAIQALARMRGATVGLAAAEAFMLIKRIVR